MKKEITYNDGRQSYSNIKALKPSTFIYKNDDEGRVRRGVIAQDVMQIDPDYVKEVPGSPCENEEGEIVRGAGTLALDSNVLLLDTVLALNYVIKQLETTQKELQELKLKIAES
ncbi:tail fiber domain-containing protein [Enterobacter bugandensis]|uniref:tail fiber domain-containing protein n=1 Tax=Enterobacter bugandensis TaxID=881260 RepID=UPI0023EBCC4D|nr:tail fiber domain-containing protein [Enterobacter bugandensis]